VVTVISTADRHCTVELQALPSRISQVRRIVSAQLRYWHLEQLIDSAALGVTELLTNVHRHAEPDKQCTVEIVHLLDRLTVSVRDNDSRVPDIRTVDPSSTHGRGLALVASVSESWGVRAQDGGGKVVWFTLPTVVPVTPRAPYALRRPVAATPRGRKRPVPATAQAAVVFERPRARTTVPN
jgi:anti-sigma regulatory factor (Ser/Thr protein kinase)